MSKTHSTTWLEQTSISTRSVSSFIWKYWEAFRGIANAKNCTPRFPI